MHILTDESLMPFGKFKGHPMKDVPASYLHWLWTRPGFQLETRNAELCEYIRANRRALEKDYPDGIWTTAGERKAERGIDESRRLSKEVRQQATCSHFNGIQEGVCRAGVPYAKWKPPLPCLPVFRPGDNQDCARCPKFSTPTREEIAREQADFEKHAQESAMARAKIMEHVEAQARIHGRPPMHGRIPCPVCGNELRYGIAPSNFHVHAACSNPDCVRFME